MWICTQAYGCVHASVHISMNYCEHWCESHELMCVDKCRMHVFFFFYIYICMLLCGWYGSIANDVGRYFYSILLLFLNEKLALAWMRSTVPMFNKIKIFANFKGNFEKCEPSLWMKSTVPILTKFEFWKMQALALNKVYCSDFYQIRIFSNPKGNFEKCGPSLWMRSTIPILTKFEFWKMWSLTLN